MTCSYRPPQIFDFLRYGSAMFRAPGNWRQPPLEIEGAYAMQASCSPAISSRHRLLLVLPFSSCIRRARRGRIPTPQLRSPSRVGAPCNLPQLFGSAESACSGFTPQARRHGQAPHPVAVRALSPSLTRRLVVSAPLLTSIMGSSLPGRAASEAEKILETVEWPEEFPFKPEDFQRYDESVDTIFYANPRFVTHIDDPAINALTKYYKTALPPSNTPGVAILDMCSSWVSHYPKGYKQERIVGLGLNEQELKRNPVLTEYVVQDLNTNPKLPFEDNSFDFITNVVSVDYLSKPLDIFKEMNRVLKPGGTAAMSFSNRCFWTKAISIWTSTGDLDHIWIVGAYFHYSGGFQPPKALDISPYPGRTDPLYVVYAQKT